MARRKRTNGSGETPVTIFHHGEARLNIPDATETRTGFPKAKKHNYCYSPHLTPKLQFDPTGIWDQVPTVIEKAVAGKKLTTEEAEMLRRELAQLRQAIVTALRERFERAVQDGDLPAGTDCATLARYTATVLGGLAVQAASGTTEKELRLVAALAMQVWPS